MANLYLCPMPDGDGADQTNTDIIALVDGRWYPLAISGSGVDFRWVCQANETWFPDSGGASCWVYETDTPVDGLEAAPAVYPNGIALVDDGFDAQNAFIPCDAVLVMTDNEYMAQVSQLANIYGVGRPGVASALISTAQASLSASKNIQPIEKLGVANG